jgi:putative ABC transport system ATP-binding protein
MADALVLDGVSKVYEVGGVELIALHDVDLTVAQEEVVTLLGPSGSGKTTLLSIAGGLLSATTGKVVVGGKNITRARARKLTAFRRKRIGFIFQAVNLVPFLTARENLLVVAELARRDRAAAAKRADRLLDELGLGHRLNNLPAQLSGGERQRVAIGRALMNQPALVLVDEPTSALDSDLGQQVMELIVSEVKARGAAAVIVTHDQRMARYGDRILTMADGRIAGMAPRPEFALSRGPAPPAELGPGPDPHAPRIRRPAPSASSAAAAAAAAAGAASSDWSPTGGAYGESPSGGWVGGRSGLVPRTGQFPAANADVGADDLGFGPDTGQVPDLDTGPGATAATALGLGTDQLSTAGLDDNPGFGPAPAQYPAPDAAPNAPTLPPAPAQFPAARAGDGTAAAADGAWDGNGFGPGAGQFPGADGGPGAPGLAPGPDQFPAAGAGDGTAAAADGAWDGDGFGPGAGQFPGAHAGHGWPATPLGPGSGRSPIAGGSGLGPRTRQVPAARPGNRWVPPALRAHGPAGGRSPEPVDGGAGGEPGWPSSEPGFGPRTGPVPAARNDPGGVPAGLWANGPAVSPGAGPDPAGELDGGFDGAGTAGASGRWPAVGRAGGVGGAGAGAASGGWPAGGDERAGNGWAGGEPAAPRAGELDGAGAASGEWPAARDGRPGGYDSGLDGGAGAGQWPAPVEPVAERERKEVPAGLWANGPAVSPGVGGKGRGTGQVPAVGRRPDPYDGLPGPRQDDEPGPPPVPSISKAQPPVSAQTPVVPAPDRVWRRPAMPPSSARPSGTRRPPQLRPVLPAAPAWPDPVATPMPAAWPEPEPQPAAPPLDPVAPAAWGTPDFFAEPPPGPTAGAPLPVPQPAPAPPGPAGGGADSVESDRVRWLQQLTPPPTKAQPRPLALPDRPIWPTRYWDGDDEPDDGDHDGDGDVEEEPGDETDDVYDFGEFEDEEP